VLCSVSVGFKCGLVACGNWLYVVVVLFRLNCWGDLVRCVYDVV